MPGFGPADATDRPLPRCKIPPSQQDRLPDRAPPPSSPCPANPFEPGPDLMLRSACSVLRARVSSLKGRPTNRVNTMTIPETRFDRFILRIRKNPVIAALIILGTLIIGLSAFTDAARNLLGLAMKQVRPEINGPWIAEVRYAGAIRCTELFRFDGDGEEVFGSASYLGIERSIVEGNVSRDTIRFSTRTREILGHGVKGVTHRYRGKIASDGISFSLQSQGGGSGGIPVRFTATKAPDSPPQPVCATGT